MSKLGDILRQVAPSLAGVLGSAAGGPLVGMAVKTLSEKLLGKPNGTQAEVETAIAGLPPEKLVELRALDNAFKVRMTELGYRLDELEIEDRKDARDMQKSALAQGDDFAKRFIYYYTWFWSVTCTAYVAAITFLIVPTQNVRVVDTVLGFLLGTLISTMIGYFYGTSMSERGSSKKRDDVLNESAR